MQLSKKLNVDPLVYIDSSMILYQINTVMCSIKVNSNTIELTVHTFCYRV